MLLYLNLNKTAVFSIIINTVTCAGSNGQRSARSCSFVRMLSSGFVRGRADVRSKCSQRDRAAFEEEFNMRHCPLHSNAPRQLIHNENARSFDELH